MERKTLRELNCRVRCPVDFELNHRLRPLPPVVKRRNLVLLGEGGDESRGVELPEPFALALALEADRRRISSRMPSSETLRSELMGRVESSSHSVNLEDAILLVDLLLCGGCGRVDVVERPTCEMSE